MAQHDCSKEMTSFHADRVTLPETEQKTMRDRRDAGRKRLKAGLERDELPVPGRLAVQGSYAMRTMIQDPQMDYDIDDGAYFAAEDLRNSDGLPLKPEDARLRVRDALRDDRLKYDARVKTNCVRQTYPEGFHIDVPVYRVIRTTGPDGEPNERYEHASGDNWAESDARAVNRWFRDIVGDLNAGELDGSQLRRVVKLTKKQSRSRMAWKADTCSGICISRLIVDCFEPSADRDDVSLRETWKRIHARLSLSTQIDHPVLSGKRLADSGDAEVAFFHERLKEALDSLNVLDDPECAHSEALAAWDKVFNTSYFTEKDSASRGAQAGLGTPIFKTSSEVAYRDDDGRRFG